MNQPTYQPTNQFKQFVQKLITYHFC